MSCSLSFIVQPTITSPKCLPSTSISAKTGPRKPSVERKECSFCDLSVQATDNESDYPLLGTVGCPNQRAAKPARPSPCTAKRTSGNIATISRSSRSRLSCTWPINTPAPKPTFLEGDLVSAFAESGVGTESHTCVHTNVVYETKVVEGRLAPGIVCAAVLRGTPSVGSSKPISGADMEDRNQRSYKTILLGTQRIFHGCLRDLEGSCSIRPPSLAK